MIESAWKVVTDGDGLTITGDSFSLTTNSSDQGSLDSVVSALQGVSRGTYGQYCGLSRAIEAVGERWGMLVVRDLLVNAKSIPQLHKGLPGVQLNLLTMRIKEMAYIGILQLADTKDVDGNDQYSLTEYGRSLEDVLLALGRWGSAMLTGPRPEDIVTEDSLMVHLRTTFVPDWAKGRSARFELHFGEVVIHAIISDGELEVGRGSLPGAPKLSPGDHLKDLLTGAMSIEDALATGTVGMSEPNVLSDYLTMFTLPKLDAPQRSMI